MKSLRENVLAVLVVILLVALCWTNRPCNRRPGLLQRIATLLFIGHRVTDELPAQQDADEAEYERHNAIRSAEYIVHNEPPEREVGDDGQPRINHGFGW